MKIRLEKFSYRFADQIINSKLYLRNEIENILTNHSYDFSSLSRPKFNSLLDVRFKEHGWETQPKVFDDDKDPSAKMDFLKDRVGVEVEFGHSSFIGIDLLKFQVSSYSNLDKIDLGIYVVTTRNFQKRIMSEFGMKWDGSLTFEKVVKYLPHFKSAIQVPVLVLGLDI